MGKRESRPVNSLYKITTEIELGETEDILPHVKNASGDVNLHPTTDSATFNMCSAPSSSLCLNRTASFTESNKTVERKEYDSSSICAEALPLQKRRKLDDNVYATSEASKMLSATSSLSSFSEISENKATCRTFAKMEPFDVVDMPSKMHRSEDGKGLQRNRDIASGHFLLPRQSQVDKPCGSECLGDNISCLTAGQETNVASLDHIVDGDKKDIVYCSASASSTFGREIEDNSQVTAASGSCDHKIEENQSVNAHKSISAPTKANYTRSVNLSADLHHVDLLRETETRQGCDISLGKVESCKTNHDQHEEDSNAFMETSNMQDSQLPAMSNLNGEHPNADTVLYDVKVCDICGDAGREEFLATCSGCIDGAEHTYCMKRKMDKLPERDWLCEECQTKKDHDAPKASEFELVSSKAIVNSHNLLHMLNTKVIDQESVVVVNGPEIPEVSSVRVVSNLVDCPVSNIRALQAGGKPVGTASQEKVLSREVSHKYLDLGIAKPVSTGTLPAGTSANNSCLKSSLGSESFKIQQTVHSPRVPISRESYSKNKNSKASPRVKLLTESVPGKVIKEPRPIDMRRGRLISKIRNPLPFESRRGLSNIISAKKVQPLVPPQKKDLGGIKHTERSVLERNGSAIDHRSPLAGKGTKTDLKVGHHRGTLKNKSESKCLSVQKASERETDTVNMQSSSKYTGSHSSSRMRKTVDQKSRSFLKNGVRSNSSANGGLCNKVIGTLQHRAPQVADSVRPGDNWKDVRVHKNNHSNRFAREPSCVRSIKEGIKSNKATLEVKDTQMGTQKNKRLSGQPDASLPSHSDLICRTSSKEIMRYSDTKRSNTTTSDMKHQASGKMGTSCFSTETDKNIIHSIEDSVNVQFSKQVLSEQAFKVTKSLRTSATPELESIWQGTFELGAGRPAQQFNGIQAHLSSCASPEVSELVAMFALKVKFEKVPRTDTYLSLSQGAILKEDSIALFFFAKDFESYQESYSKLLDSLRTNDLALRGNIDGVQLLVFPSNILPTNCQYWNGMCFLWGVFRSRMNSIESLPEPQKKHCGTCLCLDLNLPPPLASDVSNSQKIDAIENQDMVLSRRARSAKANISKALVDPTPTCVAEVSPLVGNSSVQRAVDYKLPPEQSCSLLSRDKCPTRVDSWPDQPRSQSSETLCRKGNVGAAYKKDVVACESASANDSQIRIMLPDDESVSCSQGAYGSHGRRIMREESMTSEAASEVIPRENTIEIEGDHPCADTIRKRTFPSSTEGASHDSCETSRSSDITMLRKGKAKCVDRTSSKIHPMLVSSSNIQQHYVGDRERTGAVSNSRGDERCLLPIELDSPWYSVLENETRIPLENVRRSTEPSLELSFGCEKKSAKNSLMFPFDRNFDQQRLHEPVAGDDLSLSLSLSSPSAGTKPVLELNRLMPQEPCVDTSLYLFSGSQNT